MSRIVEVTLRNHESQPVTGTLRGHFGDMTFDAAGDIEPSAGRRPSSTSLHLANPEALVADRLRRSESVRRGA